MTTVFLAIMSLAVIYLCIFVTKKSNVRTEQLKLQVYDLSDAVTREQNRSVDLLVNIGELKASIEVHRETQFQILAAISAKITKIEESLADVFADKKPLDTPSTKDDMLTISADSSDLIPQIKELRKQGLSYRRISSSFSQYGKKISPSLIRRLHLQAIEKECEQNG